MPKNEEASPFDAKKAEAFSEQLGVALNQGALCLMLSIGHRTGLFDAMQGHPQATSAEIAAKAGLHERYVREWLGAMATGGVVEVDPTSTYYRLTDEHAAFLTRTAENNIASLMQFIAMMGMVENDIVACFANGGGVSYDHFPNFHTIMADDDGQTIPEQMVKHVLPLILGLTEQLAQGIDVLDIGCGGGRILNWLAQNYPQSRFVGIDFSTEAIGNAQREAAEKGLGNVTFIIQDLSSFDAAAEPNKFDMVMALDAIHDQGQPRNVLKGIHRSLKSDGVYLMQDIRGTSHVYEDMANAFAPFLYAVSTVHCTPVSLAQGGEGLGTMWGDKKARAYLEQAGFQAIETHHLEQYPINTWFIARK